MLSLNQVEPWQVESYNFIYYLDEFDRSRAYNCCVLWLIMTEHVRAVLSESSPDTMECCTNSAISRQKI